MPYTTEQVKVSPRTYRFATSLTIMLETIMLEYYYFVLHHTNTSLRSSSTATTPHLHSRFKLKLLAQRKLYQ